MGPRIAWYFLSMKGRISRQEFWLGIGLSVLVLFLLRWNLDGLFLDIRRPIGNLWHRDDLELALVLPKPLAAAIMLWPLTAIHVKRLHDLNLSGWWLAGLAVLSPMAAVIHPWDFMIWLAILLLGLVPGARGGNRYGTDPAASR